MTVVENGAVSAATADANEGGESVGVLVVAGELAMEGRRYQIPCAWLRAGTRTCRACRRPWRPGEPGHQPYRRI